MQHTIPARPMTGKEMMAIEIMSLVWGLKGLSAAETLVLLRLADRANADGQAWPGEESLAHDTRLSPRTVRRAIRSLEDLDVILVERRANRTNRYFVNADQLERLHRLDDTVSPEELQVPDTVTSTTAPDAEPTGHCDRYKRPLCPVVPDTVSGPTGHHDLRTVREPSVEPSGEPPLRSQAARREDRREIFNPSSEMTVPQFERWQMNQAGLRDLKPAQIAEAQRRYAEHGINSTDGDAQAAWLECVEGVRDWKPTLSADVSDWLRKAGGREPRFGHDA